MGRFIVRGAGGAGTKKAKPPRLSSKPGPEITRLSEEYLRVRNEQMKAKNQTARMLLAKARGEVIEKTLVERQASFLLVALRQKILAVPDTLSRKLVNIPDPAQVRRILREAMLNLLNELQDLPSKVTDQHWLRTLEAEEGK